MLLTLLFKGNMEDHKDRPIKIFTLVDTTLLDR